MNILVSILLLTIIIPDSPAITQDNQNSNGIIVNQDLSNDVQSDYNNGIQIVKDSVNQDSETAPQQTTSTQTTSSSSGGGGGGIASSSENYSNILQFEQHEGTLITNQPTSFKFNLSIYEILLIGKENEYDVSMRVELLKDKPQKPPIKPEGEVIQYFNVITSTKRMKEAVIRFKSNQSSELLKWNGSEWVKLDITIIAFDEHYQGNVNNTPRNYQAETDSFSSFVIIKTPKTTAPTTVSVPQNTVTPIRVNTPLLSVKEKTNQSSSFTLISLIFILLIISRIK